MSWPMRSPTAPLGSESPSGQGSRQTGWVWWELERSAYPLHRRGSALKHVQG